MLDYLIITFQLSFSVRFTPSRHADVMKKIIQTVAEGGGELGVHMYPFKKKIETFRLVFNQTED